VSGPLRDKERWTVDHTLAVEAGFAGNRNAAVVVVDGSIDVEALKHNLLPERKVHVIEGGALVNAGAKELPRIVEPASVCDLEGLTAPTELPRVKSWAPEVQLLRARKNDVLAYPPTPCSDGFSPSGQVSDWVARVVVP
jgi:hypothetical protein